MFVPVVVPVQPDEYPLPEPVHWPDEWRSPFDLAEPTPDWFNQICGGVAADSGSLPSEEIGLPMGIGRRYSAVDERVIVKVRFSTDAAMYRLPGATRLTLSCRVPTWVIVTVFAPPGGKPFLVIVSLATVVALARSGSQMTPASEAA